MAKLLLEDIILLDEAGADVLLEDGTPLLEESETSFLLIEGGTDKLLLEEDDNSGTIAITVPSLDGSGDATVPKRVTQLVIEVLYQSVVSDGTETISVPSLDAAGESLGALGDETITVPLIEGTGEIEFVTGGSIEISVPTYTGEVLVGPGTLTQMGRYVVTAENDPQGRLTQMGRQAVTAETGAKPLGRLTQMGRQVLYPIVCESPEPTPPIDIPVRVRQIDLRPRWMLERFDIKPRQEEGHGLGNPRRDVTLTSEPEDHQWFLERLDIAIRSEESSIVSSVPIPSTGEVTPSAWKLEKFELRPRVEETA